MQYLMLLAVAPDNTRPRIAGKNLMDAGEFSRTNFPMRYEMKQKLFSFTDTFTIRDDSGRDAFVVRGKLFSLGKQLSFEDVQGNELAFIRQKIIAFRPTYEIYRGGDLFATVKKELFTLFRHRFLVDVPGPDDLEAAGDFFDLEYAFERGGRTVARVSKSWFSLRDVYGVEIDDGEDDVLILAASVVIDMIAHDGDNE